MEIAVRKYDVIDYQDGLDEQKKLMDMVASADFHKGFLMCLQHSPTLTMGRNASEDFVLVDQKQLEKDQINLVYTDRGGEVTAHNPGQLVVYPILPIRTLKLPPKKLVALLLSAAQKVVAAYDIATTIDTEDKAGLWHSSGKLCAVGIRIKNRISSHGIALNINNDLEIFDKIVPCGLKKASVTSLQKICGKSLSIDSVQTALCKAIIEQIDLEV